MNKFLIPLVALLLVSCGHKVEPPKPDLGSAKVAQMPPLPARLAKKAERLPDITDGSLGGIHTDGAQADIRYNDLAYRHNALVDAWGCIREALNGRNTDNLTKCFSEPSE